MIFFRCPHCKEDAIKAWELFFPSRFYISKKCRNCGKTIRFKPSTINSLMVYLIFGIILCNILFWIFPQAPGLVGSLIVIGSILIPVFRNMELFILDDKKIE